MKSLGLYRKKSKEVYYKSNIKRVEFEMLLYGYDYDYFSTGDVIKNVPCSLSTVKSSLSNLVDDGYLKIIRERAHYRPRLYSMNRTGKSVVRKFYESINY